MKLSFEFRDEKIVFETYPQIDYGLCIVEGKKEVRYTPELHAAKVEKVFRGMLRKNMYNRVQNSEFETIENMLHEEIEKLKDIMHVFEKGIKLCEQLQIEKEKLLITTETTEK